MNIGTQVYWPEILRNVLELVAREDGPRSAGEPIGGLGGGRESLEVGFEELGEIDLLLAQLAFEPQVRGGIVSHNPPDAPQICRLTSDKILQLTEVALAIERHVPKIRLRFRAERVAVGVFPACAITAISCDRAEAA